MAKEKASQASNDCFIIMPIADTEGYDKGHFRKVYEDIFKVACEKANFNPVRADEVKQTNLIHLDILQKLIDSPMAICDLSNRNPNVLFELGLRQAYDKPTVLVQEVGTPKIFDISPLRYTEYRKELRYREVLEDQNLICEAIKATKDATDKGEGINSIVGLLSLSSPASLKEVTDSDATKMLQIVMSEMNDLRMDYRKTMNIIAQGRSNEGINRTHSEDENDYFRSRTRFDRFKAIIAAARSTEEVKAAYDKFQESFIKASQATTSAVRHSRLREMSYNADSLLSEFIANHSD